MKELAIVENSKDLLAKLFYNMRYGRKFNKLNIDKTFSNMLISRRKDFYEKEIFSLIRKSKNQDDFANRIREQLKLQKNNPYANTLLLGNITEKYVFNTFDCNSLTNINIEVFSKENKEILPEMRSHFYEYIINNNRQKNNFAPTTKNGIRNLSADIDEGELLETYDKILNGEDIDDKFTKPKEVSIYLFKIIGTYTKADIMDNFDFILYDINKNHNKSLDKRRLEYQEYNSLSNNQIKK